MDLTIPLWNQTLSQLVNMPDRRIDYSECCYDSDPELISESESDDEFQEKVEGWNPDTRRVERPEPREFREPKENKTKMGDLKTDFGPKCLQIIVKLVNIHLTPDKPEFEGGTWRVEGQLVCALFPVFPVNLPAYIHFTLKNEHICAIALYDYDTSNVTESHVSFRQLSNVDDAYAVDCEEEENEWLKEVFGGEEDSPAVQDIGDIVTKEGRLLTFPNNFQHRVGPFSLADKTKPGHRKILALFLVDPHIRIISTANVPCQRKDWWAQEFRAQGLFRKLPDELMKEIVDNVEDFPLGMDEAKELRTELLEHRNNFEEDYDGQLTSVIF